MVTGGLKRVHIVIIGVVLALIMGVGIYFAALKPTQEQIADVSSERQGYEEKAGTLNTEMKKLELAKYTQTRSRVDLLQYENRYFRIGQQRAFLSMADRQKAMVLLWNEHAYTIGPLLRSFFQKNGVKLMSAITIPGAVVDPNQINPNEYNIPLGQVQVVGSFTHINNFLRSVQNAPRLIRVNNVELAGQSPNITATMDMTVVILPRDSDKAAAVPLASGDAGGGGATTGAPGGGNPYGSGYNPYARTGGGNGPAAGGNN